MEWTWGFDKKKEKNKTTIFARMTTKNRNLKNYLKCNGGSYLFFYLCVADSARISKKNEIWKIFEMLMVVHTCFFKCVLCVVVRRRIQHEMLMKVHIYIYIFMCVLCVVVRRKIQHEFPKKPKSENYLKC